MRGASFRVLGPVLTFVASMGRAEPMAEPPQPAAEPEAASRVEAELALVSGWTWRGQRLLDGAAAQPWIGVDLGRGFHAGAWGSFAIGEGDGIRDEVDLVVGRAWEGERWSLDAVAQWYAPMADDDDFELSVTAEVERNVTVRAELARELRSYRGLRASAGLGRAVGLPRGLELSAFADVGWGDRRTNMDGFEADRSGVTDVTVTLELDGLATGRVAWTPSLAWTRRVGVAEGGESDDLVAGVTVALR